MHMEIILFISLQHIDIKLLMLFFSDGFRIEPLPASSDFLGVDNRVKICENMGENPLSSVIISIALLQQLLNPTLYMCLLKPAFKQSNLYLITILMKFGKQ